MDISLAPAVVGLLSSVVTELFKMFPLLRVNPLVSSATAIVVMIVGTLVSLGGAWDWNMFVQVVIFSFLSYKMLIQPVAVTAESRTQQ